MVRWQTLTLLWLLALSGCEMPPATATIYSNDFEAEGRQQPAPPSVVATGAHSGEYAARLNSGTPYAAGWEASWGSIGQPHKIRVQAWAFLPNNRLKGGMVMEVKRGESVHYWKLFDVHPVVKRYYQWEPIHRTFVLPRDLEDTDRVRLYAWNYFGTETWYLDDILIEEVR